jgi:hypothetical protein
MTHPDGPEERTADLDERFDADFERIFEDEAHADLSLPVHCVVNGHDWHPRTRHCRRCGERQMVDLSARRVMGMTL